MFFGVLAVVCLVDLAADLSEHIWGWSDVNLLAIAMDVAAAGLAVWIFADLHGRRPKNGGGTHRGG
jgi:hypothetical protein